MTNHPNRSKPAQFREGQEVEVLLVAPRGAWRKAKIVVLAGKPYPKNSWEIQFQDGFHAVFDAEHIRAIPIEDIREIADEDRKN